MFLVQIFNQQNLGQNRTSQIGESFSSLLLCLFLGRLFKYIYVYMITCLHLEHLIDNIDKTAETHLKTRPSARFYLCIPFGNCIKLEKSHQMLFTLLFLSAGL